MHKILEQYKNIDPRYITNEIKIEIINKIPK